MREETSATPKILIVDDEANMQLVLRAMLKKEGYDPLTAGDGIEALRLLRKSAEVAAVVTDLKMPHLDGMALLYRIIQDYPDIPVIIITAHGTVATAVDAMKKGAFDYITKPFDMEEIKRVIAKAVRTKRFNEHEPATPEGFALGEFVSVSPGMKKITEMVAKVAPATTTVLITGETGTGKERIADAIHRLSDRRNNPFIKINCAALTENLVESELFGYERGAFTGAVSSKPGRFELAHKGTLFLDEVGELPMDMQTKLLRVIQEQSFERVGGIRSLRVDVRLIAATNRNLIDDVRNARFREDLYYRLHVFPIHLPPLRERKEDIPHLASVFLRKFNEKLQRDVRAVSPEAMECLVRHAWPGNIREMENVMERLILLARGDTISRADLPEEYRSGALSAGPTPTEENRPFRDVVRDTTESVEKEMILRILEECDGNISRAAKQLGISRRGLHLKLAKYFPR